MKHAAASLKTLALDCAVHDGLVAWRVQATQRKTTNQEEFAEKGGDAA